jgi:hypothetical protein
VWTQSSAFISFAHPPSGVLPRKPRALIAAILIPNLSPFKSALFACKALTRKRPAVDDEPVTTVVPVAVPWATDTIMPASILHSLARNFMG